MYRAFYLCLLSFCLAFELSAQVATDSIHIDFSKHYIERPLKNDRAYYLDKGIPYAFRLDEVIHSGKAINSGPMVEFASSVVKSLTKDSVAVFVIESNLVGAFSSPEGRIFFTSGLMAQAANEDQVAFFAAREIYRLKNNWFPKVISETAVGRISYNEKLESVLTDSINLARALDARATRLIEANGYDETAAASSIDLIRLQHLPYKEISVPNDYLNSDKLFVPKSFFELPFGYQPGKLDVILRLDDDYLNTRQDSILGRIDQLKTTQFSENEAFLKAQRQAREKYAEQAIMDADFDLALYSVFLLETEYGTSDFTKKLKAYAWMGFALTKMGYLLRKPNNYHRTNSKSTAFFFFLRQLEPQASIAIALRAITDIQKESPEVEKYRDFLLNQVKEDRRWNLKGFSQYSYYDLVEKEHGAFNGSDKYKSLDSLRQSAKNVIFEDSMAFYKYAIPDLIKNNEFWNYYDALGNQAKISLEGKNIIIYPSVSVYKKFGERDKKSTQHELELLLNLQNSGDYERVASVSDLAYHKQKNIKDVCSQLFQFRQYQKPMPVLFEESLSELGKDDTDYILISMFQGAFRPELRSYYFFAIFVAPLPFILPEVFLRSHQSMSCVMLVNAKTGAVERINFDQFNTSLSPELMLNYINLIKT